MNCIRSCKEGVPCRLMIALMVFSTVCVNYMMRVSLSVNLVAMVPVANHTYSDSQVTLNWTVYEKAQVLGGFTWGYLISASTCGPFIQMLGPKLMILLTASTCSVLSILSPVAAKHSYITMVVLRVTFGLASGPTFPALHALISKWAVATERGRFLGMLIGGAIGTFFAWSICGLIIDPLGWEWGFYLFGIIGLIWLLLFWYLVYDTLEIHPRITASELLYIQKGLKATDDTHIIPPYSKIVLSVPCWSLFIINFGTGWGIYFVITAVPNYLASALGYSTSSTGLLSGLIYLLRSSCALGFGSLGDILLEKNILPVNKLRKLASVLSHVVPGCLVLCMTIPGHQPLFYVSLMMLAMGFNGFVTVSSVCNAHDLTTKYVGTLTGIAGTFTAFAGTVSPFVTAFFTKDDETNEDVWRAVFLTGGLVYIISGLQFCMFGSTKLQSWDSLPQVYENNKNEMKLTFDSDSAGYIS